MVAYLRMHRLIDTNVLQGKENREAATVKSQKVVDCVGAHQCVQEPICCNPNVLQGKESAQKRQLVYKQEASRFEGQVGLQVRSRSHRDSILCYTYLWSDRSLS